MSEAKDYVIRRASLSDVEGTVAYLGDLFASRPDTLFLRPGGFEEEEVRSLIEESAVSADKLFLLAARGEEVVGTLTLSRYGNTENRHCGEFGMSVHPGHRRRGVGRRLIEAMETWAVPNGIVKIELQVWSNNTAAVSFYSALGYQVEGVRKAGIVRDGHVRDVILMGKLLGREMVSEAEFGR